MNNLYIVTERGGRDLFESFDDNPDGVPELWVRICTYMYMYTYIDRYVLICIHMNVIMFESFDDNPDGVPELWVCICTYIYMYT
jgi:hypothetical protein